MAIARAGLSALLSEQQREREREEEEEEGGRRGAQLIYSNQRAISPTQRTGGARALLFNYVC